MILFLWCHYNELGYEHLIWNQKCHKWWVIIVFRLHNRPFRCRSVKNARPFILPYTLIDLFLFVFFQLLLYLSVFAFHFSDVQESSLVAWNLGKVERQVQIQTEYPKILWILIWSYFQESVVQNLNAVMCVHMCQS